MILFLVSRSLEKSSIELKLQENENNQFALHRAKFATLRLLINAFQAFGANKLHFYLEQKNTNPNLPIPFGQDFSDLSISQLSLESFDHYYFINRSNLAFENPTTRGQIQILTNLLQVFSDPKNNFQPRLIPAFLGQLNDWLDFDNAPTTQNLLQGMENYPKNFILSSPKNALLDNLSELNALPAFSSINVLKPSQTVYDLPIRIIKPNRVQTCDIGPLNLNMLPKTEEKFTKTLTDYFNLTQEVNLVDCGYKELYQNKDRLLQLLLQWKNQSGTSFFSSPLSENTTWAKITDQLGAKDAKTKLDGFFSARSHCIEVRFRLTAGKKSSFYLVHFLLDYPDQKTELPSDVRVMLFTTLD